MADEPIEYGLKDFLEEIGTVISEKQITLEKALAKHNEPVAGLTQLRIDRLKALGKYLAKIEDFQKGKAATDDYIAEREEERSPAEIEAHAIARIREVATELRRMGKPYTVEALRTFTPLEAHHLIETALSPMVDEKREAPAQTLPLEEKPQPEQPPAAEEPIDDWD